VHLIIGPGTLLGRQRDHLPEVEVGCNLGAQPTTGERENQDLERRLEEAHLRNGELVQLD
jgi:hypothetical protein